MKFSNCRFFIFSGLISLSALAIYCSKNDNVVGHEIENEDVVSLVGNVYKSSDGTGVAGVIVKESHLQLSDTTDAHGSYTLHASKAQLTSMGINLDTVKDGHVDVMYMQSTIKSFTINKWIDTLPDVFIMQRSLKGTIGGEMSYSRIEAVICDKNDTTSKSIPLWFDLQTHTYTGFFLYSQSLSTVDTLIAYVRVLDSNSKVIGRSQEKRFPTIAGDITFADFSFGNALPVVSLDSIRNDSTYHAFDTLHLYAKAIDDFNGKIVKTEWNIFGQGWNTSTNLDTEIILPDCEKTDTLSVAFRATDNEGLVTAVSRSFTHEPLRVFFYYMQNLRQQPLGSTAPFQVYCAFYPVNSHVLSGKIACKLLPNNEVTWNNCDSFSVPVTMPTVPGEISAIITITDVHGKNYVDTTIFFPGKLSDIELSPAPTHQFVSSISTPEGIVFLGKKGNIYRYNGTTFEDLYPTGNTDLTGVLFMNKRNVIFTVGESIDFEGYHFDIKSYKNDSVMYNSYFSTKQVAYFTACHDGDSTIFITTADNYSDAKTLQTISFSRDSFRIVASLPLVEGHDIMSEANAQHTILTANGQAYKLIGNSWVQLPLQTDQPLNGTLLVGDTLFLAYTQVENGTLIVSMDSYSLSKNTHSIKTLRSQKSIIQRSSSCSIAYESGKIFVLVHYYENSMGGIHHYNEIFDFSTSTPQRIYRSMYGIGGIKIFHSKLYFIMLDGYNYVNTLSKLE